MKPNEVLGSLTDLISEGLAEDDLWGHPVGRPDEGVPPLVHLAVLGRHAKVRQLHLAVVRQEHVTWGIG